MKLPTTLLAVLLMAAPWDSMAQPSPIVLESVRDGFLDSLQPASTISSFTEQATTTPEVVELPLFMPEGERVSTLAAATHSYLTQTTVYDSQIQVLQSFDGAKNDDNAFQAGVLLAPPDTDGDVGLEHYVQMLNIVTTIFDKSGNVVLGPFPNNLFWAGLGGLCESTNRGDPIVLYDEETNRWLMSQFAFDAGFTNYSLCIAVSTTDDPTGSYYRYEFDFTGIGFPDYPKYGFATDAIGVMANLFTPPTFGFGGTVLGAIDKSAVMSGGAAAMVLFILGPTEFGFVAGDNDGPVFDNMPPTFATNNDGSGSTIDFWEIHPDFDEPANSTISEVASIPVAPFDGDLCPAFRERCIDQPGSGTGDFPNNVTFLEAISDRLMHRLQLRNYGDDKYAVVTHTVDADGSGKAGKRWYEFRNRKDRGWKLFQQNTVSPDGDHRWMGSIAMNDRQETMLGYSVSGTSTYPSIGVSARRGHADEMNMGDLIVFDGNDDEHVQRQTSRWGDYSAMAVDPIDGTFWYTQEYAKPNSFIGERFGWATKIFQLGLTGTTAKVAEEAMPAPLLQVASVSTPAEFGLSQNYPNPFNPATVLSVMLPEEGDARLAIYDALGREVALLVSGTLAAGDHNVVFNAKGLPSGVYVARLDTEQGVYLRRMLLVK